MYSQISKLHNIQLEASRVLIIDDNKDNTDLLMEVLQSSGYTNVLAINDPRKAVSMYKAFEPDIVLLDLNMPYVSGFDLLKEFTAMDSIDSIVPILVLTALTDTESRDRALVLGALDFLTKPFDAYEVVQRLSNLLTVRHLNHKLKIKNDHLSDEVHEKDIELQQAQVEIIQILGQAVEFRDVETGYHIERISTMSRILANCAGVPKHTAELIESASPMHDVGKIGIPDAILLKPAALTPAEFDLMKTHSLIGYKLLHKEGVKQPPITELAAEIALNHHERWDGTGYPYGVSGENIPLSGRIVGLVDVFDALTSQRVYKPAFNIEESIDIIHMGREKHFDPTLVDLFVKNADQFVQVIDDYTKREKG
ncbi:MAG: response regulator [Fibrobacterales bacterium]